MQVGFYAKGYQRFVTPGSKQLIAETGSKNFKKSLGGTI
jgi:hypothetical protein